MHGIIIRLQKIMEKRYNAKSGKLELKLQPEGLPAIWIPLLCNRCEEYKECLQFKELTIQEWENTSTLLNQTLDITLIPPSQKKQIVFIWK